MRLLEFRKEIPISLDGDTWVAEAAVNVDEIVAVEKSSDGVVVRVGSVGYEAFPFTYKEMLTLWQTEDENTFNFLKDLAIKSKNKSEEI